MARKIEVEIVGDSNSLKRALGDATDHTSKFGSTLSHIGKVATEAFAVVGGAAVAGIGLSVKAAVEAQESQARLEQAFKNVGLSAEAMAPQIDKAEAAGRRLGFTDDDVRQSLGSLVTATGDAGKAMDDLGVAQDLARFKGVGLEDATKMITVAMTGSQRAAKQLGITVQPVTTAYDSLKATMGKTIDSTEKLALAHAKLQDKMSTGQAVIDAVNAKVHGQGQAFADTAAGGLAQFHAQVQHIEEEIGGPLLSALSTAAGSVSDFFDKFSAAHGLEAKVKVVVEGLEDAGKKIDEFLFGRTIKIRGFDFGGQETIVTQGVVDKIEAGLAHADWSKVANAIARAINDAIDKAHDEAGKTADRAGQSFGEKLKAGIVLSLSNPGQVVDSAAKLGAELVVNFGLKLSPQLYIERFMAQVVNGLTGGAAGRAANAALDLGHRIVEGLGHGVANIADTIHTAAEKIYGALKSAAGEAFGLAVSIGRQIIGGVLSGLGGLASAVGGAIKHGIEAGVHAAGGLLHGSGEFEFTNEAVGVPLVEGIINGIGSKADDLGAALAGVITRIAVNAGLTFFKFGEDMALEMVNGIAKNLDALTSYMQSLLSGWFDAQWRAAFASFGRRAQDFADELAKRTGGGGGGLKIPGLATGGPVTAGGAYIVGEQGPELFTPGMGGTISPAGSFGRAGGEVHYHFEFPNYVGSRNELVEAVISGLAKKRYRGGLA